MTRWTPIAPAVALALVWAAVPAAADETDVVTVEAKVTYLAVDDHEAEAPSPRPVGLDAVPALSVDGVPFVVPSLDLQGLAAGTPVEVTVEVPADLPAAEVVEELALGDAGGVEVLDVEPTGAADPGATPSDLAAASGGHTLTIVPVTWTAASPPSSTALNQLAATAAAYWTQQSAGQIAFSSVQVLSQRAVSAPAVCTEQEMTSLYQRVLDTGVAAPSATRHVVVYFPSTPLCGWAGLGEIYGGAIWVNGQPDGSILPDVLTHELGHNFGLGHANRMTCTEAGSRVPLTFPLSRCTYVEYGDVSDVMGIALGGAVVPPTGSLNVAMADALGLATVLDTGSVSGPTVVELAPISSATGLRGLRTAVADGLLYTEYRPAVGRDTRQVQAGVAGWAGVQLRLALPDPESGVPSTYLIDAQPGAGSFQAPAVPVGGTTPLTSTALDLTVQAAGATATVLVSSRIERYITAVYRDLFGRGVDPDGLATWRAQLSAGTPRVAVANAITSSDEFRMGLIQQSYATYLGRTADTTGLAFWLDQMRAGMKQDHLEAGFLASEEYYLQVGRDDSAWIRRLYQHVLGREPGGGEVAHWIGVLGAGVGRGDVARGFLLSTEHLSTVIDGHYVHLLGRHLDPNGLATWVGALQSGVRIEDVIGGIIASEEYFLRV